ncbi:dTDP-4-dehydrorhamnose 3,5-epimerase family protein [Methylobacterium radiodurans]|uniref:dTDP-4-dehydrorhamnose 3,5-epimerase n=1 Tax=Methylobacterium radiodurans TaxID=2202828 RepID=A0A2U8VLI3_9HYPH|nr:dTDP-4-dehydrorhamnose 3,5-epimerase family protein [Methylobacterium radiodurans]AWN34427.1 dTDP-4-dehydrorhamnose 3,5-epimerase [Methylobacterium radiodurans]
MFEIHPTALPQVAFLRAPGSRDARGGFRKLAHAPALAAAGLRSDFAEIYCSTSQAGVVRGMHFQAPPHQHAKLVWCLEGRVTDVVLDLRPGERYGRAVALDLDGAARDGVYVPEGCAHGFAVRSDHATLLYMVTSVHAPEADLGIRWDGFGFDWGVESPILSERDRRHPGLKDFATPF